MVIDFKVTHGYRTYHIYWQEGDYAEMRLFLAGDPVSEWQGDIDQILEVFREETGVTIALPVNGSIENE